MTTQNLILKFAEGLGGFSMLMILTAALFGVA